MVAVNIIDYYYYFKSHQVSGIQIQNTSFFFFRENLGN